MANTYTQIHIQIVFTVQNRICLIHESWKHELYKYITGIIKAQGHKLLVINGMPDHVHLLLGLKPHQSLSDLVKHIKGSSSRWINTNRLAQHRFSWQGGFGAFSYSLSDLESVIGYINNQEEHHRKKSFYTEYLEFLRYHQVDFQEQFIFKKV